MAMRMNCWIVAMWLWAASHGRQYAWIRRSHHFHDQMRDYAEQAVAAERERCAQMVAGKPFVDTGGAQARRGPSSVGTWHERSPCGNLMSAMAEALRKHGITG